MRGCSECGWLSRQAVESYFNEGLCKGIWPPWDIPELCRYTSMKLHTSNVGVFCCFTSPSPADSTLAKDSAVVRVLGYFLFLNLKSVCKGIACSSTSASQDAYVYSPTHVCRHDLSVSQAEPRDGKALCAMQQRGRFPALSQFNSSAKMLSLAYRERAGRCMRTGWPHPSRTAPRSHRGLLLAPVNKVRNRSLGSFILSLLRYFRHAWYNDSVLQPKGVVENLVKHAGWAAPWILSWDML